MAAKPKIILYLVHEETGQKYPVIDEVVIGRNSGEICFPDDSKMSSQHCRILKTPHGPGIHDLKSGNGTFVDGVKLQPDKMYNLKAGSTLTVANQVFKTVEPSVARKVRPRRRKKRPTRGIDLSTWFAGTFLIAALSLLGYSYFKPSAKPAEFSGKIVTPFELVEKDVKSAMNEYAELGRDHAAAKISDKELNDGIRKSLIPKLNAAQAKMAVIKPTSEYEKRKLAAHKSLLTALLAQVDVIALAAATQDKNLAQKISELGQAAEAAKRELEKVESIREPARYDY